MRFNFFLNTCFGIYSIDKYKIIFILIKAYLQGILYHFIQCQNIIVVYIYFYLLEIYCSAITFFILHYSENLWYIVILFSLNRQLYVQEFYTGKNYIIFTLIESLTLPFLYDIIFLLSKGFPLTILVIYICWLGIISAIWKF